MFGAQNNQFFIQYFVLYLDSPNILSSDCCEGMDGRVETNHSTIESKAAFCPSVTLGALGVASSVLTVRRIGMDATFERPLNQNQGVKNASMAKMKSHNVSACPASLSVTQCSFSTTAISARPHASTISDTAFIPSSVFLGLSLRLPLSPAGSSSQRNGIRPRGT